MSCKQTKCANPICSTYLKACKLINGLCPACYEKSKTQSIIIPKQ